MTARPPRASTKGDAKRPKGRAATHGDKVARAPSVIPTGRFERVADDDLVEETDLSEVPQLRMLVYEGGPHLAAAQSAIAAAGHLVVAAAGRDGLDRLRPAIAGADALLIGLPGGEPLIDAALALDPPRPVVIAASTSGAVEAARRAAAAGADLAAVRPHDVERLAPILLAAARLVQHRRALPAEPSPGATAPDLALEGALEELSDPEPGALQPAEVFQQAFELELQRARRYDYPLSIAVFSVDIAPPPPPAGVRGILRARAGNALVHAIRDIDLATELDQDRFLVLMPHTDRLAGAELARRIISAVAAGDPVIAAGRTFPPKVIGAVTEARPSEPQAMSQLVQDATQLLEQAQVTGASLAVES
jgi:two-component system, cell cycle response regulator